MKKANVEAAAGARKGATEAMDDSLFAFDYDEQMKVREGRPWKKDPKYFKKASLSSRLLILLFFPFRSFFSLPFFFFFFCHEVVLPGEDQRRGSGEDGDGESGCKCDVVVCLCWC